MLNYLCFWYANGNMCSVATADCEEFQFVKLCSEYCYACLALMSHLLSLVWWLVRMLLLELCLHCADFFHFPYTLSIR